MTFFLSLCLILPSIFEKLNFYLMSDISLVPKMLMVFQIMITNSILLVSQLIIAKQTTPKDCFTVLVILIVIVKLDLGQMFMMHMKTFHFTDVEQIKFEHSQSSANIAYNKSMLLFLSIFSLNVIDQSLKYKEC